jgi:hypothetical protein
MRADEKIPISEYILLTKYPDQGYDYYIMLKHTLITAARQTAEFGGLTSVCLSATSGRPVNLIGMGLEASRQGTERHFPVFGVRQAGAAAI